MVYDPTLGYDPATYDPFMGQNIGQQQPSTYNPYAGTSYYNPQPQQIQNQTLTANAQAAYQQAMAANLPEQLAFQQAQQAYTDAMSMGSAFGYMPGGNLFNWNNGNPTFTQPLAGSPTMQAVAQGQTLTNQQLANQLSIAGVTGNFAAPLPSQYSPGTVLTAPSTTPGLGNAYGIVNADGSVSMMTTQALDQYAGQRGTTAQALIDRAQPVNWNTLQQLSMGPPTGPQQQTLAAQQQAYNQAVNSAQLTGMFYDPTQTVASYNQRGMAMNGQSFSDLPQDQQAFWLQYNQNNPTLAAQAWAAGTNQALQSSGMTPQNQGTSTLAAQQQQFQQGLNTAQFGLSVQNAQQQAAQQYLGLLGQLQGPADYGQYLKVLGSTPAGLSDLVGAAAGRYLPGGGSTGAAPQAQTLGNLVGAATGYAGGGSGANAAPATSPGTQTYGTTGTGGNTASPGGMNYQDFFNTAQGLPAPSQIAPQSFNMMNPSQKQMLGSMYANIGYAPTDINSMYQMSLPKYAAGSAAGNMKLV